MSSVRVLALVAGLGLCTVIANAADRNSSAQVRQKLNTPLPPSVLIDFSKGVSLRDALEFLRDVSDTNFHVNWKAIEAAGITADTQVNFRLRNVSPRKVLNMVLEEAGGDKLAYYVDEGIVEVTTREVADSIVYTIVYPVQDLLVEEPEKLMNGMGMGMGMMMMMGGLGGGGRYGGGGYGGGGYGGGRYGGGGYGGGGSGGYGGYGGFGGGGMGMWGGGMGGWGGGMGGWGSGGYGSSGNTKDGKPEKSGDDLVELIKATVYPNYWTDNKASIKYYQGNLIVTAPRIVQEAIGGPID